MPRVSVGAGVSGMLAGVAETDHPAGTRAPSSADPDAVDAPSITTLTSPEVPALTGVEWLTVTVRWLTGVRGALTVKV